MSSLPPDHAEREEALNVFGSFIVEAPAGSGKTGLLMQRYLRLLGESEIEQPEQVLAITFTRKAAAEMRNRITSALQSAAEGHPLNNATAFDLATREFAQRVIERGNQRGWDILRQSQRLNITTIDALCAQIVRRLPLLTGGGDQQPVPNAGPLYAEAPQRTLRELGGGNTSLNEALHTLLTHLNGRFKKCEELIAVMLQWRDQWLRHVVRANESADVVTDASLNTVRLSFEHILQKTIADALNKVASTFDKEHLREASRLAHIAAVNLNHSGDSNKLQAWLEEDDAPAPMVDELPRWLGLASMLLTDEGDWRKRLDVRDGFPPKSTEKSQITELLAGLRDAASDEILRAALDALRSLPPAIYPEDHWQIARSMFRVLHYATAQLDVLFAERRQCDFTAISMAAVSALQKDDGFNDLALAMGTRIQHLLVDELQDTSITQYDLLKSITASWDGVSQTVFLVGDPRQSIYLFREARVELFHRTLEHGLGELQLQPIQLTANFRSQAKLVDAFNDDFALIFNSQSTPASALLAATNGEREWHRSYCKPRPGKKSQPQSVLDNHPTAADCGLNQAEEIAERIGEHLPDLNVRADNKPPIAILVRSRSHAMPIIAALRKRGISYKATELDTLAKQPEVLDILALTLALLHPGDRTAWLAVLRAPWCGLTLASLLKIADSPDSSQPIAELIEINGPQLESDEEARLLRIWKVLQTASQLAHRLPLAELVERTWTSLGGVGLAANYQREDKTPQDVHENIEAYLTLLDSLTTEGVTIDATLLQQRLEKLYASPSAASNVAVEILTMHAAKGLEWEVVFVPALHKSGRNDEERLLEWYEFPAPNFADHDAVSALLSPIPVRSAKKDSAAHQLTNWVRSFKTQRKEEELKRLFYVACTRARQHLHLFAVVEDKPEYRPRKDTLLNAAWPAFVNYSEQSRSAVATLIPKTSRPQVEHIAAVAEPMVLNRLQANAEPLAAFNASINVPSFNALRPIIAGGAATPARPESSLAARALGNVVHRWMETLATLFASGKSVQEALDHVSRSSSTITALLRHEGAPIEQIRRLAERVMLALNNTLKDPNGLWLLSAHPASESELAISLLRDDRAIQLRMDRVFESGTAPHSNDEGVLWIADYKTSEPIGQETVAFLEHERALYRRQLEGYAEAMRLRHGASKAIRLALYYPLLPALDWWEY